MTCLSPKCIKFGFKNSENGRNDINDRKQTTSTTKMKKGSISETGILFFMKTKSEGETTFKIAVQRMWINLNSSDYPGLLRIAADYSGLPDRITKWFSGLPELFPPWDYGGLRRITAGITPIYLDCSG